jgi:lambda family phage portal protein
VTQYQLLPPEFLDHSYKERTKNGQIIGGVEYDDEGRKVAYHLWKYNPKDANSDNKRVKIDAKDVTLLRKRDFLGQARGVPELSNSMLKLKDLGEYEFAQLLKQKISACHVDYITSNLEEDSSSDKNFDREAERIEPGTRKRLRPGEDVTTSNPPSVENYDTYVDKQLMAVASSLGVPFCLLSSEFRGMNYSSFRGAWLAFHKDIDVLRDYTIIPLACDPMVEWFIEDLKLIGISSKNWEYSYTSPRRELIDPTKEIPSLIASIRSGINSLPEVHRSLGKNSNEILNEIARSNAILDELKLELDSDGRIKLKYQKENKGVVKKDNAK